MLRLKECRVKAGYTQAEVAEWLGISEAGYRHWEKESRDLNLKDAVKLAVFFHCSLDDLINDDDDDNRNEYALSGDETKLIELYRSTDNRGKHAIMAVAESQRGDTCIPKINKAINA